MKILVKTKRAKTIVCQILDMHEQNERKSFIF